MSKKILITPRSLTRSGHPAIAKLETAGYQPVYCTPGQTPSEDEMISLLPGCVGWLAGVEPITSHVLESAKDLRAISRNGTGVNNVDLEAAKRLNIAVLRAEGANAQGVAELAMGLFFALVRSIPFSDAHLKSAEWERRQGIELIGKTLGLVGCGAIGCIVAKSAIGCGMKVVGYDPFPNDFFAQTPGFAYVSLEEVRAKADLLSLHCPPLEGKPLVDADWIASMKNGAYLVNTARGELLDETAVIEALDSGKLSGVAMDAFRKEPPTDDPLVRHPKVIATPHIGAFTQESVSRAVTVAIDNLLKFLAA
ncbi:MAG: phosphoglycerate dehydrogenase [Thermoguttaceae bacterium]|nr:phosphoglycerate dehydrogenase [Thermoguttaceae bacterium]